MSSRSRSPSTQSRSQSRSRSRSTRSRSRSHSPELGEKLLKLISEEHGELAPKITNMLLLLPEADIQRLLHNHQDLQDEIDNVLTNEKMLDGSNQSRSNSPSRSSQSRSASPDRSLDQLSWSPLEVLFNLSPINIGHGNSTLTACATHMALPVDQQISLIKKNKISSKWEAKSLQLLERAEGFYQCDVDESCLVWMQCLPSWRQKEIGFSRSSTLESNAPVDIACGIVNAFPDEEMNETALSNFDLVFLIFYGAANDGQVKDRMGHIAVSYVPSRAKQMDNEKTWAVPHWDSIAPNSQLPLKMIRMNTGIELLQSQGKAGATPWEAKDIPPTRMKNAKAWARLFVGKRFKELIQPSEVQLGLTCPVIGGGRACQLMRGKLPTSSVTELQRLGWRWLSGMGMLIKAVEQDHLSFDFLKSSIESPLPSHLCRPNALPAKGQNNVQKLPSSQDGLQKPDTAGVDEENEDTESEDPAYTPQRSPRHSPRHSPPRSRSTSRSHRSSRSRSPTRPRDRSQAPERALHLLRALQLNLDLDRPQ